MIRLIALVLVLLLTCLSCTDARKRTIPLDKMAVILADLDLADKMAREFPQVDQDSISQLFVKSLLKVHNVSQEELDLNLYLYQSDYEVYEKLLKKVGENYDAKS